MKKNVFISTGAFQTKNLKEIIDICLGNEIPYIELGPNVASDSFSSGELIALAENEQAHFLIHNYFPPPLEPFVLNLASSDLKILERSRTFCKDAIRWAVKLKSAYYSVHAGYCFHALPAHLGNDLSMLDYVSVEEAEDIFVESLKILADYATKYNISVIVENNVLAPFNLVNGENKLLLGVTAEEIIRIMDKIAKDNIGILLDVGHLFVSSKSLGFSAENFIDKCARFIKYIHLSDNDGHEDSNKPLVKESWFWKPLKEVGCYNTVLVLEAYNLHVDSIRKQIDLISSKLF